MKYLGAAALCKSNIEYHFLFATGNQTAIGEIETFNALACGLISLNQSFQRSHCANVQAHTVY